MRIHESQVIDNDFRHGQQPATGTIRLAAGLHPFRLYYRSGSGTPRLSVKWAGPDTGNRESLQRIPDAALFQMAN